SGATAIIITKTRAFTLRDMVVGSLYWLFIQSALSSESNQFLKESISRHESTIASHNLSRCSEAKLPEVKSSSAMPKAP
ncbi:MAG: hypothetical protein CMA07_04205, partial [Euryarchaeota archaeon]|nr:hypothetical protein [Euryarchaeota archaeon]